MLKIRRQKNYIPVRTQAYRVTLEHSDPVFVCESVDGLVGFTRVIQAGDEALPDAKPTNGLYRTTSLDLVFPSDLIANETIAAIIEDLKNR